MRLLRRIVLGLIAVVAAVALTTALAGVPPSWGAAALLHPLRRPLGPVPALAHRDVTVSGDGVTLRGWSFPAQGTPRGLTVVYLHGVADNRASGTWIAHRLVPRGYDVLAWDGRAHGESTGGACTYGVLEKRDVSRVLDALGIKRAVLVGVSLGAAIAIQAAAEDERVVAVVAASSFSDLETVARERAPPTMRAVQVREALALAEAQGAFRIADASPLAAAPRVRVPVLLVHGADDRETPPDHSRRLHAALASPKVLRIAEGAGHSGALSKVWPEVERWLDGVDSTARGLATDAGPSGQAPASVQGPSTPTLSPLRRERE